MTSLASLNRGRRCVQELSEFDELMGWAFKNLHSKDEVEQDDADSEDHEYAAIKTRELTCTALGVEVALPPEFVAPTSPTKSSSSALPRSKPSSVGMAGRQPKHKQKPTSQATRRFVPSRASSPPRAREPVDFVYDVAVRRRLREQMDHERVDVRTQATAKEATLRAAHQWVADGSPERRRQAWGHQPSPSPPHATDNSNAHDGETKPASRSCRQRPQSAHVPSRSSQRHSSHSRGSSNSSNNNSSSSRSRRGGAPGKTSIAPNVSEWRAQAQPFHVCPEQERLARVASASRRRVQQQRDDCEVEATIDAFEQTLKRWAC